MVRPGSRIGSVTTSMQSLPVVLAALSVIAATAGGAMVVASTYADEARPESGAGPASSYTEIHDAGVTGANVSVGVIEPTGFDLDALGAGVVAARAFGSGKTLVNGGVNEHGTTVARTIGRVAPDSNRYLAAFDEEADFREAVRWMADQDVDVVVVPAAFYGKPGDGTAWSSQAVQRLARNTVVVAAAGNVGTGSWQGTLETGADRVGRPRDPETGRKLSLRVSTPRTQVWLSWQNPDARYSLRIVRNNTTVATSKPYPADAVPNEVLDARLNPGRYEVVVQRQGTATSETLRLQTPTDAVEPANSTGSLVSPATARGVIVVGAFDQVAGRVPPYSSRGPTLDGRTGVDVVAPERPLDGQVDDSDGTSYAAARTAGLAALVLSADPERPPHGVESTIEQSAWDIGEPGPDRRSGAGLIRPGHAIARIRGEA